jgi:hypothetical protein
VSDWCKVDDCPASVCGGPHRVVRTTLGEEILRADQEPTGALLSAADVAERVVDQHFLACRQMTPDCLVPLLREALEQHAKDAGHE